MTEQKKEAPVEEKKNDMKALVTYSVTEAAISEFRKNFLPLKIENADDKEGYKAVVEAQRTVREKRLEVEARRKDLKKDSLEFGRLVDSEAKKISEPLEEIEAHLKAERERVDIELAERKFKAEQEEKLPFRIAKLEEMGEIVNDEQREKLLTMDDAAFENLLVGIERLKLKKEREEAEAAQKKIDEENAKKEAELKAEEDRIKKEQEAKDAELNAERDKLEKEKQALEAEKKAEADRKEAERLEVERKEREAKEAEEAEKARIAAEAKKKKEEEERLKLEKKYQEFLAKNGYNEGTKHLFRLERDGKSIILFKKVDEITL